MVTLACPAFVKVIGKVSSGPQRSRQSEGSPACTPIAAHLRGRSRASFRGPGLPSLGLES